MKNFIRESWYKILDGIFILLILILTIAYFNFVWDGEMFSYLNITILLLISIITVFCFKNIGAGVIVFIGLFVSGLLLLVLIITYADNHVKFVDRVSERTLSNIEFIDNSNTVVYTDNLSNERMTETLDDYYKAKASYLSGSKDCVSYTDIYRYERIDYNKTINGFECK